MRLTSVVCYALTLLLTPCAYTQAADCVVLLHGLARTDHSFSELNAKLIDQGYLVVNHHYPSTQYKIKKLAKEAIPAALAQCKNQAEEDKVQGKKYSKENDAIHFVTHSMGGILVRQYLKDDAIDNLGRVVMLGPPNKGSEVVDKLGAIPGFAWFNGPAGMQLGTGVNSVPNTLGPANFDLGIIAGTRSINLILSSMLPNPDDGKVSVANTKLTGMSDHITMAVTHPFMMSNDKVIEQVIYFLAHGKFWR
jgi:pimeloyl-ACP methyl ester carboxylesterase